MLTSRVPILLLPGPSCFSRAQPNPVGKTLIGPAMTTASYLDGFEPNPVGGMPYVSHRVGSQTMQGICVRDPLRRETVRSTLKGLVEVLGDAIYLFRENGSPEHLKLELKAAPSWTLSYSHNQFLTAHLLNPHTGKSIFFQQFDDSVHLTVGYEGTFGSLQQAVKIHREHSLPWLDSYSIHVNSMASAAHLLGLSQPSYYDIAVTLATWIYASELLPREVLEKLTLVVFDPDEGESGTEKHFVFDPERKTFDLPDSIRGNLGSGDLVSTNLVTELSEKGSVSVNIYGSLPDDSFEDEEVSIRLDFPNWSIPEATSFSPLAPLFYERLWEPILREIQAAQDPV